MDMISDALLIAGALGAAFYCRMLAQRLSALKNLDSGLGAAIAALSRQVDDMKLSLAAAKDASGESGRELERVTVRAETAARRLELLIATLRAAEDMKRDELETEPEPRGPLAGVRFAREAEPRRGRPPHPLEELS